MSKPQTQVDQYKHTLMKAAKDNPKLYGEYISKKGTILDPLLGRPLEIDNLTNPSL